MCARTREQAANGDRTGDRVREEASQKAGPASAEPFSPLGRRQPVAEGQRWNDHERRQGHAVTCVSVEAEIQERGCAQCGERQDDILEQSEPDDSSDCIAPG